MGLKQMIEKAMQGDEQAVAALPPVEISGEAQRAYAGLLRQWTGWDNATLTFGEPEVSPFASCNRKTHVVTANPERLLLNPHRVLLKVNPFRLRQEAVLTGALLHEAAHARHSHWIPRNEIDAAEFKHSDGSAVTEAEISLAKTLEEPRIEGIVAAEAASIGADGLAWTLRASAAYLVPMTDLSADPDQALMDLVTSWALRAGRQLALEHHIGHRCPRWVSDFTVLLQQTMVERLTEHYGVTEMGRVSADVNQALEILMAMLRGTTNGATAMFRADASAESDSTLFMIDYAKELLALLFPETPPGQMPQSGGSCGVGEGESGDSGSQGVSDLGDEGEGNSEPEDEGSGDDAGAGDSGGQGEDEGEGESDKPCDTTSAVAKALVGIESQAKTEAVEQGKQAVADPDNATKQSGGTMGGMGSGAPIGGGWRRPSPDEREVQSGAEKFLRDLIEPNVASKVRITDQPSSMIDGAALAAWKAGGQVKAPRFFEQVKRTVKPTPPVKIAVLVDISASMDEMQRPSALLSWALASACLDLRNYAGGGVMIESTLIHWGSSARVIQKNGEVLPGIREVGCFDGTSAMHMAYEEIANQIPGFFDVSDKPENKLIVQFTDWHLAPQSEAAATHWVGRGLEAGASLLSIVPSSYSGRHATLSRIMANSPIQRGRTHILRYDPRRPQAVWAGAASALSPGS